MSLDAFWQRYEFSPDEFQVEAAEAIAAGMVLAAELSRRLDWLTDNDVIRIRRLFTRAGLPVRPPAELAPQRFRELMAVDKKVQDGKLRLVLLRSIGRSVVTPDFSETLLEETLKAGLATA